MARFVVSGQVDGICDRDRICSSQKGEVQPFSCSTYAAVPDANSGCCSRSATENVTGAANVLSFTILA